MDLSPHVPSAFFLGLTTLDLLYFIDEFPEPNEKMKARELHFEPGGPAYNAATTFAHLGGQIELATVIGSHEFRDYLLNAAQASGLHLHDLAPDRSSRPAMASILTLPNGDRTIITQARAEDIGPYHLPDPVWKTRPDVILIDGYFAEAATEIMKAARAEGIPVVMDGGSWKSQTADLLPLVDVLICSADFHLPADLGDSLPVYCASLGIQHLAITRGEQPVLYYEAGQLSEIPVPTIDAVDTLGAGDVFHGAFCWYYASGNAVAESLKLAGEIAAKACERIGARGWM